MVEFQWFDYTVTLHYPAIIHELLMYTCQPYNTKIVNT